MIRIAIDGPGGAGKSSVAKKIAKELGIIYVDTGALYRTIGLYMLNKGISTTDAEGVVAELGNFTLELKFENGKQVILLDGNDVGDTIRAPEVSMAASNVSAIKEVRAFLLEMQRNIAKSNSVIMDGRDIGTVILPDAEVKIFLTASPEARAKRRYDELIAKGKDVKYEDVYNEMVQRDKNDSSRAIAPCVPAEDAIMLDNSGLTLDGTAKSIIKIAKKKQKELNKNGGYMVWRKILSPFIKFFCNLHIKGAENVPKEGGYVICSNHIGVRDVFLIGVACPRHIKFVGKKELFAIPVIGWIMKKFGAIKLDRGGSDVAAIKASVDVVKKGSLLALFPQGHRYPGVDPATTPKKNGAGMVCYRTGADVIPVAIKVKNNKYGFFRRVDLTIGKPIKNEELMFHDGGNDEYKRATDVIFANIVNLGGLSSLPKPTENSSDGETK